MFTEWPGYFRLPDYVKEQLELLKNLDSNSPTSSWLQVFDAIQCFDAYISNDINLEEKQFPSSRWTFAHHAAYHSAPTEVVLQMRKENSALTCKDAEGKIPLDHVDVSKGEEYKKLFVPEFQYGYTIESMGFLNDIEKYFHEVINSRVEDNVKQHSLVLPW